MTSGSVTFEGEDITNRSPRWRRHHGIARSFQRTSVFPSMSVRRQLEMVAHKTGERDLDGIVDVLGLGPVMGRVCSEIAYGTQRSVDLALALLGNPKVVLLDEPCAGLVEDESERMLDHVRDRLRERDVAALWSSTMSTACSAPATRSPCSTLARCWPRETLRRCGPTPTSLRPTWGVQHEHRRRSWSSDGCRRVLRGAVVLRDVSFAINAGETVGLVGRNGAGKTTALMSVYGVPTVTGRDPDRRQGRIGRARYEPAGRGVSLVPQGKRIFPNLTVEENIQIGRASGRTGQWTVKKLYELFPNLERGSARMGTALSGGEQQMLAIARALMAEPDLLMLDEPTEGLAPVIIDQLTDALATIRDTGTALLLVEQHIGMIEKLATRYLACSRANSSARARSRSSEARGPGGHRAESPRRRSGVARARLPCRARRREPGGWNGPLGGVARDRDRRARPGALRRSCCSPISGPT